MRFRRKKVRDQLAFGVFWSDRKYLLSRAKFVVLADEIAALARRLGRPPRVLDAGIGRCRLQRLFPLRYPDLEVEWHGLDLLDFRLRIRIDVPGVRRVRGRIEAIPYRDDTFDAVVCCWVMQHLDDPEAAVEELSRVLRPGGTLALALPHSPWPVKPIQERFHPRHVARQRESGESRFSYHPQIQFFDLRRIRRMVRRVGTEPVRWQGIGLVTGGPLSFLENHEWYYRWNLWIGARTPRLTKQVVCVARDRAEEAEEPSTPVERS